MKQIFYGGSITIFLMIFLFACQHTPKTPELLEEEGVEEAVETTSGNEEELTVSLKDQEGIVRGTALITEDMEGVHIDVKADHLTPGRYGFHIHEKGICNTPNFETAGGHFNPNNKEHGLKHKEGAHAGDLENIVVRSDGSVNQRFTTDKITLEKDKKHTIYQEEGTSLMMHEKEDDGLSQPAGNAGERMICGVITVPLDD